MTSPQSDQTVGITAYGAYIPRLRLQRRAIVDANRWFNPAIASLSAGERSMCNWDEDAVTMAVEAGRDCLGTAREGVGSLVFASTSPPFDDRQNAAIVSNALNLADDVASMDLGGSLRAGTSALINAFASVGGAGGAVLVLAGEHRRTQAGNLYELRYGDGAAGFTVGCGEGLARLVGSHQVSVDFVDHYRGRGADFDYGWEERWVRDAGIMEIVPPCCERALEKAGLGAADIDHFVMPGLVGGANVRVAKRLGIRAGAVSDTLHDVLGDTGAVHPLMLLADVLQSARAGKRILVVGWGQGCDAVVLETTPEVESRQPGMGVSGFLARRSAEENYSKFLAFNRVVELDHGMRSEVDKQTALSALYRNRDMLTGFIGGVCRACGTRQFPRSNVCVNPNCGASYSQDPQPFADMRARIQSWTADNLTYSPDPPQHFGMIVFDEGGRLMSDITDVTPGSLAVGMEMRMVFRIKDYDDRRGFTRYFWKATPGYGDGGPEAGT